jgi:hypothetical protein
MNGAQLLGLESAIPPRPDGPPKQTSFVAEITSSFGALQQSQPRVLSDMTLPDNHLQGVAAALQSVGFTLSVGTIEDLVLGTRFRFTKLTRGTSYRALLYIPDEYLTVVERENKRALEEVRDLFEPEYKKLYVFHRSPPTAAFRLLMEGEWLDRYEIEVKFIALSELADLVPLSPKAQEHYLRLKLDADDAKPAMPVQAPEPPRSSLSNREKRQLRDMLKRRAEFDDVRSRRALVESAGLDAFALNFDFNGNPGTVAWALSTGSTATSANCWK